MNNGGGPTGPRVEIGSATLQAATPEPASIALIGMGLAGFAGFARARRK